MKLKISGKTYHTTPKFNKIVIGALSTALAFNITAFAASMGNVHSRSSPILINPEPLVKPPEISKTISKDYLLLHSQRLVAEVKVDEPLDIERLKAELSPKVEENKPVFIPIQDKDLKKLDLRQPSNLTAEQANLILKGSGMEGLGKAFIEAESKFKINALYLISHAALESCWGTSNLSKKKNNLFGFTAYDDNPTKHSTSFSSKSDCILFVAEYISKHYLSEDGQYYNGPTLKGMNVKYASDQKWSDKITDVMASAQDKIIEAQAI